MAYQKAFEKAAERKLIATPYLELGLQSAKTREKMFTHFFDQRKWNMDGWDDQTIEILINELSTMDTNNYPRVAGVGEREGRIYSSMVGRRHYRLSHGIGRSGDLLEAQPKAAGSSLLASLTNSLVLDLIKSFVSKKVVDAFIVPMATGMSLTLTMLTMKSLKPDASYVIWCRIDQKSCFKSITTAGLIPIIIPPVLSGDELVTNVNQISKTIEEYSANKIVCVLSTTSCFAPRGRDKIADIAKICSEFDVFHLVNNAYGVQSQKCSNAINDANRTGRVDAFVQSTDKNLMVPVGGAILSGFNQSLIKNIKENYPGRASGSQTLDVFITMLSMGRQGYTKLLRQRDDHYEYLRSQLHKLATKFGERVLSTPGNNISIGMTLSSFQNATEIGSMLFRRNINGTRVVVPGTVNNVSGFTFQGWGSHINDYPYPYLTCAATIGMEKYEVDTFIDKLEISLNKIKK